MSSKHITTLLLTLMLSASAAIVRAQDVDALIESGQPGLLTDEMPGIGNLLPVEDLLATDESLATEVGPNPGGVPVDGGLSLLLAAGAAYGARRLRRRGS
jgi:hypothetical protein